MKLTAPTKPVFLVTVALAILALLGAFGVVAPLATYDFWTMTIAYVVLALACLMKGL